MIRRCFKKRSKRARTEGIRYWVPALSPFTFFLLGFVVVWRILSIVPIIIGQPCDYPYFWMEGWSGDTSILQLMFLISFLIVGIGGINLSTKGARYVIESCVQISIGLLLVVVLVNQYTHHVPYNNLRAIAQVSSDMFARMDDLYFVGASEPIKQCSGYPTRLRETLDKAIKENPFSEGNSIQYEIVAREDYTVEYLKLSASNVRFFNHPDSPLYSELNAMRQCVANNKKYLNRVKEIENDQSIIWVETIGYSGWSALDKANYRQVIDMYDVIWDNRQKILNKQVEDLATE